jgi:hypothetical protein
MKPILRVTESSTSTMSDLWPQAYPNATHARRWQLRFRRNVWTGIVGRILVGTYLLSRLLYATVICLQTVMPGAAWRCALSSATGVMVVPARRTGRTLYPRRLIWRGGPIVWLSCSPDLTPLNLLLWGHLKENVYTCTGKYYAKHCCLPRNAWRLFRTSTNYIVSSVRGTLS